MRQRESAKCEVKLTSSTIPISCSVRSRRCLSPWTRRYDDEPFVPGDRLQRRLNSNVRDRFKGTFYFSTKRTGHGGPSLFRFPSACGSCSQSPIACPLTPTAYPAHFRGPLEEGVHEKRASSEFYFILTSPQNPRRIEGSHCKSVRSG